jgi:large subunit ribosomal protein L20
MPRSTNVPARHRRRKRILKAAKGFFGSRSKQYKTATSAVDRAKASAYRDRKRKKRDFRRLWITRISAACRMRGIRYSVFMNSLKTAGIDINRKMLSEIAIADAKAFDTLVETANAAK